MYYAQYFRFCQYAEVKDIPTGADTHTFTRDWFEHRAAHRDAVLALTDFHADADHAHLALDLAAAGDILTFHNAILIEPGCNVGETSTFEVAGRAVKLRYVPRERLDIPAEPGPINTVPDLMPRGWPGQAGDVGILQLSAAGWGFMAYPDPTLRRAPELDLPLNPSVEPGHHPNIVGWRCRKFPRGFRTPVGFLPGPTGEFVADYTTSVTLRVPREFVAICESVDMTPEQLLRGFVGDLAGIHNFMANPRADSYGSNGSDERDMADAWFERAYGMLREDVEMRRARDEEAREHAEASEFEQEERNEALEDLYSDFVDQGRGGHDEFIALLRRSIGDNKENSNG